MRCPACDYRFSLREVGRIYNPFRIECSACELLLSTGTTFGRMLLTSLTIGALWGTVAVVLGVRWPYIAASLVLGLGPMMAVLTRRMLKLHPRAARPVRGWHHGPGPRSVTGYAALAVNLLLYLYVLAAAATHFVAGFHAPQVSRFRPLLSVLGDLHYVYLPVAVCLVGMAGILSRRVVGRVMALVASGALTVVVLAPDLTIWRVLRDFGRDGTTNMSTWPYVITVALLAGVGIALLCTPGARRYYGRTPSA